MTRLALAFVLGFLAAWGLAHLGTDELPARWEDGLLPTDPLTVGQG